jgi:hypothetical protein
VRRLDLNVDKADEPRCSLHCPDCAGETKIKIKIKTKGRLMGRARAGGA